MNNNTNFGVFRGRTLVQTSGSVGGARNVFVKLQGIKNDLVYPTFGGPIMNPFKGPAKFYAGDLFEFRTDSDGVNPKVYLLKTFEVLSNSTTTVNIKRDGYRHIPFVGDIIMVAPDNIGGTGTGVKVTAVTETTVTVSSVDYNVWQITTSASLGNLSNGTILVEAEETGAGAEMLVKNINSVADCDGDFFGTPLIVTDSNLMKITGTDDAEFEAAKYYYAPALGGLMYINKMSPLPQCVLDINRSNVNGWFKVNYYDMDASASSAEFDEKMAVMFQTGSSDPTSATVGELGSQYINTTDHGMFYCTNITGTTSKTYTWSEVTFK